MSAEQVLERTQRIELPIERTFDFFGDAANLEAITPPWLRFRIVTPRPIDMGEGALIEYRLKLHGIPVRWRTRIETWEPPHRFVDVQLIRPVRPLAPHAHVRARRRRNPDPRPGPLPDRLRPARLRRPGAARAPRPRADLRLQAGCDRGADRERSGGGGSSSLTGRSRRRPTSSASAAPTCGPATSSTSRAG